MTGFDLILIAHILYILCVFVRVQTEESGLCLPPATYVRQLSREPRENFRFEEDSKQTSSRRRLGSDESAPYQQAHEGLPSTYRGSGRTDGVQ